MRGRFVKNVSETTRSKFQSFTIEFPVREKPHSSSANSVFFCPFLSLSSKKEFNLQLTKMQKKDWKISFSVTFSSFLWSGKSIYSPFFLFNSHLSLFGHLSVFWIWTLVKVARSLYLGHLWQILIWALFWARQKLSWAYSQTNIPS